MNILDTKAGAAVGLGLTAILAIYLFKNSVKESVNDAAYSIAPTNPNNIFSEGVDSVGAMISGNQNFSLGGWIYDITHGDN